MWLIGSVVACGLSSLRHVGSSFSNQLLNLCPLYCTVDSFFLIYLFLATLGVYCHVQAFSSRGEQGWPFVAGRGFSIGVTSVAEHGLLVRGLQQLQYVGSGGVAHRPNAAWHVESFPTRKIPHALEQLSPCAPACEPELWSLCPTARKATAMRSPRITTGE